jgi:hypothetical protein
LVERCWRIRLSFHVSWWYRDPFTRDQYHEFGWMSSRRMWENLPIYKSCNRIEIIEIEHEGREEIISDPLGVIFRVVQWYKSEIGLFFAFSSIRIKFEVYWSMSKSGAQISTHRFRPKFPHSVFLSSVLGRPSRSYSNYGLVMVIRAKENTITSSFVTFNHSMRCGEYHERDAIGQSECGQ